MIEARRIELVGLRLDVVANPGHHALGKGTDQVRCADERFPRRAHKRLGFRENVARRMTRRVGDQRLAHLFPPRPQRLKVRRRVRAPVHLL